MTGTGLTTVCEGLGKCGDGAPMTPAKTMFHTDPVQNPNSAFLEKYCCCEPDVASESTLVSARKPPLDQPWPFGVQLQFPMDMHASERGRLRYSPAVDVTRRDDRDVLRHAPEIAGAIVMIPGPLQPGQPP